MNQHIFALQNRLPSSPVMGDRTFLEARDKTSSFLEHLHNHLSEKDIQKEPVTADDRQETEWSELAGLLMAEDWEEVPEALELLALLQDGDKAGEIMPVNLTALFGGEPGESVEIAIRTLGDLVGIEIQADLSFFPPDEKGMEILASILQQSLSISKELMVDGEIQKPVQIVMKWAQLVALTHAVNESEGQSIEAKEWLTKALDQWKEKIPSLLASTDQAEKDKKLQQSTSFLQAVSHDSILGLSRGGRQELLVNQTALAGDLQIKDNQTLVVMKNGQIIESNELMKQLDSVFTKAKFSSVNGLQRLQIQLTPENLGTLQIEMTKKNGQILATIVANTQQGKEILESHLHSLKMTLANQGIQMDRIVLQDSQTIFDEHLKDQHHSKEEQQERLEDKEDTGFESFLDELQELLINEIV